MGRKLLPAAALACAVMTPALAYSQSTATFTALDLYGWSANGTSSNTVTITSPASVTFEYPPGTGKNTHNVVWDGTPPPCDGNIPGPGTSGTRGWKGTCSFDAPGTYRFECKVHAPLMKGTVVVVAPEPSPVETASATPTPTGTAPPSGGGGEGSGGDTPVTPQATPQPITSSPPLIANAAGPLVRSRRVTACVKSSRNRSA